MLLVRKAKNVLKLNDEGLFTKPSPKLYPHQWSWDSAFIALGLAQSDPERAQSEITSLLRGQWKDGMLPQIIFTPGEHGYFPGADYWQSWRAENAPQGISTSGITQPPMITIAAYQVALKVGASFAHQVYPSLSAYHRWLHTMRDPAREGLAVIIHPWESGMDNSPRWIESLSRVKVSDNLNYERQDDAHVPSHQRPSKADYDRFVTLVNLARDLEYDQSKILSSHPFLVQDVAFNAILYHADECLRKLAEIISAPVEEIDGWMQSTRDAFQNRLWNQTSAMYLDYDFRQKVPIHQNTIAGLIPLYAGLPDEEQARRLVETHLLNIDEYAPDHLRTHFFIPTTSKDNAYYDPLNYWRGPIWVNTNWMLIEGLRRYEDYQELAQRIRSDTLALLERFGFFEYFDPKTGKGLGTKNFSWSAALAMLLLENE